MIPREVQVSIPVNGTLYEKRDVVDVDAEGENHHRRGGRPCEDRRRGRRAT